MAEEVTFINKGAILNELNSIPDGTSLQIDACRTRYLDNDIVEILEDFLERARLDDISITLISEKGTTENLRVSQPFLIPLAK